MRKTILVLNGPNLNLLGQREPEIYGKASLADIEKICVEEAQKRGLSLHFRQSNAEHVLIDWIHAAREEADAIIINPAAYSHTSIALLDALKAFVGPVAEVHLSNIHQRENFRHHSFVSMRADCVITGCGVSGYLYAIDHVSERLKIGVSKNDQ